MTCEAVVLAMPPASVQRVLREEPKLCAMIPEVKMQSCWTVALTLKTPLDLPFEICILKQSSVLMGAIRQAKPDRDSATLNWWIQADYSWSEGVHDKSEACEAILTAFVQELEPICRLTLDCIEWAQAFHWEEASVDKGSIRAAMSKHTKGETFYQSGLAVCGDWVSFASGAGAGVGSERAHSSGTSAGKKILSLLRNKR